MPTTLGPSPLGLHTNQANVQGKSKSRGEKCVSPSSKIRGQQDKRQPLPPKQPQKQKHPNQKTLPGQPRQEPRAFQLKERESLNLMFSSEWIRPHSAIGLLEATQRQSHTVLSNCFTHSPPI